MANTPQAKKRIRRNTARTVVNKNRVSRIRTLVKKVENAVAAGDKD
ncbi:MAG: 30S ribosomal protein S20, partial [Sphingopyxis sp.]